MEVKQAIKLRVSTRSFLPDRVPEEMVNEIVQAALYAPVGMHRFDTLRLTVLQDKALLEKIRLAAVKASGDEHADPLHGAPLLVIVSSSQEGDIAGANAACLVENMLLCATDLGLGNLYVRGVLAAVAADEALLRELNIPEGMTPLASAAVGYAVTQPQPRETPFNDVTKVDYIG